VGEIALTKRLGIGLVVLSCIACAPGEGERGSETSGMSLAPYLADLRASHVIHADYSVDRLQRYIAASNPGRAQSDPHLTNADLARRIIGTAACFGLDPVYFAAMIHKESTFKRDAESETGARGFTQLVRIGAAEVNHQLGFQGGKATPTSALDWNRPNSASRAHANGEVIDHFRRVILACDGGAPAAARRTTEADLNTFLSRSINSQLAALPSYTEYSLEFGAMMLKIHVARSRAENLAARYDRAMFHYNGDVNHQRTYVIRVKELVNAILRHP
jgi:hypothetical protein